MRKFLPAEMQESFLGVRRPLGEAETLPPWCYTSPDFFAIEIERIFSKVWNFIGPEDRIAEPGSFFTTVVAGVQVLVVRGKDRQVRAFQNTCRHRGTRIAAGEGSARSFSCPYHSWTYDLNGALLSAPHMSGTINFSTAEHGLLPIRLETWGGFLFINLDSNAPDLKSYLGDLPNVVAPYGLANMTCVRRRDYQVRCNWKIYVENSKDSEHVASVHRNSINQTSPANQIARTVLPSRGHYLNTFMKNGGSAALLRGEKGLPKIPSLIGDMAEGTMAPLILPATYLGCTVDCAWYLNVVPVAVNEIRLETGALFPSAVIKDPDFETLVAGYYRRWDTTAQEDNAVCELQQLGLESHLASAGRLSMKEELVHRIDNWVVDRVTELARAV